MESLYFSVHYIFVYIRQSNSTDYLLYRAQMKIVFNLNLQELGNLRRYAKFFENLVDLCIQYIYLGFQQLKEKAFFATFVLSICQWSIANHFTLYIHLFYSDDLSVKEHFSITYLLNTCYSYLFLRLNFCLGIYFLNNVHKQQIRM